MLTSTADSLTEEEISVADWLRYVDMVGYIDFEEFLELPPRLTVHIAAIRNADRLKELKKELMDTKDKDTRYRLENNIKDLESFFDE